MGIGNEKNLLFPNEFCYVDLEYELLCYYRGGELLYPKNPPLYYNVNTDKPSENNFNLIRPYQCSQSIHFPSKGSDIRRLRVCDIPKSLVLQENNLDHESYQADISSLAEDMNFYIIENASNFAMQLKIIIYE
mgnify:CR=1 FL=1